MITAQDYLQKPHIYLETAQGRKEIFAYLEKVLKRGLKEDRRNDFMYVISEIESFLTGKDPIFVNLDIPNVHRLWAERKNIKRDALVFFGERLDLIKIAFFKTSYVMDKFDILFLLIKFMPQVQDIEIRQFTDLYLILFYTIRGLTAYPSLFEGTEEEKDKLANLVLKAFGRYDAKKAGRSFVLNRVYEKSLEEIGEKYRFYKEYLFLLDKWVGNFFKEKTASVEIIIPSILVDEVFSSLSLTDKIFSLLDWKYNGKVKNLFLERMDKIETFIFERINILFEGVKGPIKKEMSHIINGYLNEYQAKIY